MILRRRYQVVPYLLAPWALNFAQAATHRIVVGEERSVFSPDWTVRLSFFLSYPIAFLLGISI